MSRRIAIAIAVGVLLASASAAADPDPTSPPAVPILTDWLHFNTPAHVVTDGGADLRIPMGYFLDEPTWAKREVELKRLQDAETRLTAENTSFRASASSWQPGWVTAAIVFAGGLASGWYIYAKTH